MSNLTAIDKTMPSFPILSAAITVLAFISRMFLSVASKLVRTAKWDKVTAFHRYFIIPVSVAFADAALVVIKLNTKLKNYHAKKEASDTWDKRTMRLHFLTIPTLLVIGFTAFVLPLAALGVTVAPIICVGIAGTLASFILGLVRIEYGETL